jgi:hypothetical protein
MQTKELVVIPFLRSPEPKSFETRNSLIRKEKNRKRRRRKEEGRGSLSSQDER